MRILGPQASFRPSRSDRSSPHEEDSVQTAVNPTEGLHTACEGTGRGSRRPEQVHPSRRQLDLPAAVTLRAGRAKGRRERRRGRAECPGTSDIAAPPV